MYTMLFMFMISAFFICLSLFGLSVCLAGAVSLYIVTLAEMRMLCFHVCG